MKTVLSTAACVAIAATLPSLAMAEQPFAPTQAVENCLQAAAVRLHRPLQALAQLPNMGKLASTADLVGNQLVLRLQSRQGQAEPTLVCTYNRHGQVQALRRAAPVDVMPGIDAGSIFMPPPGASSNE